MNNSRTKMIIGLCLSASFFVFWVINLNTKVAHAEVCATGNQSGVLSTDTLWCTTNSPYTVNGDLVVAEGVTLTIQEDVTVKVRTSVRGDGRITVYGTLNAKGTAEKPIIFTSGWPDPAPRDWEYLHFTGTSVENLLENVIVEYGGAGGWVGAINIETSSLTIQYSTITNNFQFGIRIPPGNTVHPIITYNNFIGNGTDVGDWETIMNEGNSSIIARCNYFGNASGPSHIANPFGGGDPISDSVIFIPWLIAPSPGGACTGRPLQIFLPILEMK